MTLEEQLLQRYLEIVKANQEFLDSTLTVEKLSKLFLTPVPDGYENAKNKVRVVGRETRHTLDVKYDEIGIERLLKQNLTIYRDYLVNRKTKHGKAFFKFLVKVENRVGKGGVIWSNIYSLNYKGKHVQNLKDEKLIKGIEKVSEELLKAQIEILKPKTIIFAIGKDGYSALDSYFDGLILKNTQDSHQFKSKHFKAFILDKLCNQCYRIHHPSATRLGKKGENIKPSDIEKYLLELLPTKD